MMELFSPAFWSALMSIIIIDLVLAGDNAIVIGMAARNLPEHVQMRAILWGTVGAIGVRILATVIVVWLLKIPGLQLLGGLLLIWIAYKLLVQKKEHVHIEAGGNIWGAIRTIVMADAVMGLDNVLAIAGASHGSIVLVVLGLLISVPIIVWCSTLIIKWIERYPFIIYIGAGVIAFTAGKMITAEPWSKSLLAYNSVIKWSVVSFITAAVIVFGILKNQAKHTANN